MKEVRPTLWRIRRMSTLTDLAMRPPSSAAARVQGNNVNTFNRSLEHPLPLPFSRSLARTQHGRGDIKDDAKMFGTSTKRNRVAGVHGARRGTGCI